RAAAGQPERRRLRTLQAHAHLRRQSENAPHALDPAAAAEAARAAGIRDDRVALDADGKGHLEDLDGRVHRVRDTAGHAGDPVLGGPRAEAALDRLVGNVASARTLI